MIGKATRSYRVLEEGHLVMVNEPVVIVEVLNDGKLMYVNRDGKIGVDDCSRFTINHEMVSALFK